EDDLLLADLGRQHPSSAGAIEPAYLEYVDIVGRKLDRERQTHRIVAEIRHADLLKALALPQQSAAKDVNLAAGRDKPLAVVQIHIRHVDSENGRVVGDAGVQQQRPHAAEGELEPRQKASVRVVE